MCELHVNRVKNRESYTIINNTILRDKNISSKAKMILCFVLSLPSDWNFSREGLISCVKEGKTAVNTALKELEEFGYLVITKTKKDGKYYTVYEFYEIPIKQYLAVSKKPKRKLRSRKSAMEKTTQINTNKINTESNEIKNRVDSEIIDDIKTKINYNILVKKYEEYNVNKIVMIIANIITSDEEDESSKTLFSSLTSYQVEQALEKAKSNSGNIKNYDAWIKKVLCNIPPKATYRIRETDWTTHVESEDGW